MSDSPELQSKGRVSRACEAVAPSCQSGVATIHGIRRRARQPAPRFSSGHGTAVRNRASLVPQMRDKQPYWHAIQMVPCAQCECRSLLQWRRRFIRLSGQQNPLKKRDQRRPSQAVKTDRSAARHHLRRNWRTEPVRAEVESQRQRLFETQLLRAARQLMDEVRGRAEVPEQAVQIHQVANSVARFRIQEQVRRTVQNLIDRIQDLPHRPF